MDRMPMEFDFKIFRDREQKRRIHIRPYERLIMLVRGYKPYAVPTLIEPDEDGMAVVSMAPVDPAGDPEYPAVLLMVKAEYVKGFASWEVEDTGSMIDMLLTMKTGKLVLQ